MKKYATYIAFFFSLSVLIACQSEEDKERFIESKKGTVGSEIQDSKVNNHVPETTWRFYEGKMGPLQQRIILELGFTGKSISGRYFYARQQKFLILTGTLDSTDTNNMTIHLEETYRGKATGHIQGRIQGNGNFEGIRMQEQDTTNEMFIASPMGLSLDSSKQLLVSFSKFERSHSILTNVGVVNKPIEERVVDELMLSAIDHKHFVFSYHTIGTNYDSETIEGIATKVEKDYAIFTSSQENCMLSFKFKEDSLIIEEEEDCSAFRGIGVSFENELIKVD